LVGAVPKPSPETQTVLEPDDQVLCFDFLYFVSTDEVCATRSCVGHG
jgi:hypothetical protein